MTDSPVGEGDFTLTFDFDDDSSWEDRRSDADGLLEQLGRHTWVAITATAPGEPDDETILEDVFLSVGGLHAAAGPRATGWSRCTLGYAAGLVTATFDGGPGGPAALTVRPLSAVQETWATRWDDRTLSHFPHRGGAYYVSTGDPDLIARTLDVWDELYDVAREVRRGGRMWGSTGRFDLAEFYTAVLAEDDPHAALADLDVGVVTRLAVGWSGTTADLLAAARAIVAPAHA